MLGPDAPSPIPLPTGGEGSRQAGKGRGFDRTETSPPPRGEGMGVGASPYTTRSTIIFLISAIALAGFSPLGQVLAQFMMVWQR